MREAAQWWRGLGEGNCNLNRLLLISSFLWVSKFSILFLFFASWIIASSYLLVEYVTQIRWIGMLLSGFIHGITLVDAKGWSRVGNRGDRRVVLQSLCDNFVFLSNSCLTLKWLFLRIACDHFVHAWYGWLCTTTTTTRESTRRRQRSVGIDDTSKCSTSECIYVYCCRRLLACLLIYMAHTYTCTYCAFVMQQQPRPRPPDNGPEVLV